MLTVDAPLSQLLREEIDYLFSIIIMVVAILLVLVLVLILVLIVVALVQL